MVSEADRRTILTIPACFPFHYDSRRAQGPNNLNRQSPPPETRKKVPQMADNIRVSDVLAIPEPDESVCRRERSLGADILQSPKEKRTE
jgi:hypothetical protein